MKHTILSVIAMVLAALAMGYASVSLAGYDPATGGGKGDQFNRPDFAYPDLEKPPVGETPPVEKQPRPNVEAPH